MDHREELLRVFHLGPEDLEANRSGTLSARQGRQLVQSGIRNVLASVVIGALLAAILYFIASKPLKPVQFIVAGILFAAALLVGIRDLRRTRAAAAAGRVECLTGPIEVQSRGRQGWHLVVAGRSFRLPVRPWHLKSGAAYRVYLARQANRIVAMEPDGWG